MGFNFSKFFPIENSIAQHDTLQNQVGALLDILPGLTKYKDQTFVIKIGNNHISDLDKLKSIANDIALLRMLGINVAIVHGGGPKIVEMVERLGAHDDFIDDQRVVDAEVFEIIEMVLRGSICPIIVSAIQANSVSAIGISGRDAGFITADKLRRVKKDIGSNIERILNLGLVGKPVEIETEIIYSLFNENIIPVISPVATSKTGQAYILNADVLAAFIASKLEANKLFLLCDCDGIMNDKGEILGTASADELAELVQSDVISPVMKQKALSAIEAVRKDVSYAHILNGMVEHIILLELLSEKGVGTTVYGVNHIHNDAA